jgi:hypothetical protein
VEPTLVRIAHANPLPGNLGNGTFITHGYLVVLSDDPGRRALPVWFTGHPGGGSLARLSGQPESGDAPEELTARLLGAAGARVTGVDIGLTADAGDELDPDAWTARIELDVPAGPPHAPAGLGHAPTRPRHVTARLGLGLAMAAAADAPVRMPGAVLDRLAVPVEGDDLIGPFLDRLPPAARPVGGGVGGGVGGRVGGWPARLPSKRARYEPRNLTFADGLDWWDLDGPGAGDGTGTGTGTGTGPGDYAASTQGGAAILAATTMRPAGPVALVQVLVAEDYRGATVTFSGELRTARLTYEAGLRVEILRDRLRIRDDHGVTIAGHSPWTRHEVTVKVPSDAEALRFGIVLSGPGEIALRNPTLTTE